MVLVHLSYTESSIISTRSPSSSLFQTQPELDGGVDAISLGITRFRDIAAHNHSHPYGLIVPLAAGAEIIELVVDIVITRWCASKGLFIALQHCCTAHLKCISQQLQLPHILTAFTGSQ